MTLLLGLLYAAWCGVLWRVRGGAWETLLGFPAAGLVARGTVAVAMSLPLLAVLPTVSLMQVAAPLWLGMALAGWGDAMDIGRVAGSRWGDAIAMSAWGVVVALPAAIVAACLGGQAWPLLLAGVLFGPIYALAWHLPRLPDVHGLAAGPTEWAEVACGAALGVALWAALP